MIRDFRFYKKFLGMFIVLVLQNILTFSVNLADNIMLGGYSEAALSGATAVNQIQFIYLCILTSLAEAVVILGSQYYGRGLLEPIRHLAATGMRIALGSCFLLFVLVVACPHLLLQAFTEDEVIIQQGLLYLRIIRFTFLFFAITQMLLGLLRSVGVVQIALVLSASTLIINCTINYTLIYGHFGAPELGIQGAAIGTLTARIIEMLIVILYLWKGNVPLPVRCRDFFETDRALTKDYLLIMLPMLLVNSLWGFNTAVQNAIIGHLSSQAFAANSVSNVLYSLVKSGALGASSATSYFTGRAIGAVGADQIKLRRYTRTVQVFFVGIGLVSAMILYLLRTPILGLYELTPETYALADQFLVILSVVIIGMAYQMPANSGIIRGGGTTVFPTVLDIVSIWCFMIPLSAVMAFVIKASPAVVVFCLNSDQLFKCIPVFFKVNYGRWARELTRSDGMEPPRPEEIAEMRRMLGEEESEGV